jgi:hypothetical protein
MFEPTLTSKYKVIMYLPKGRSLASNCRQRILFTPVKHRFCVGSTLISDSEGSEFKSRLEDWVS